MPKWNLFFALFALLLSSLACATVLGEGSSPEPGGVSGSPEFGNIPSLDENPSVSASCPVITEQIVGANTTVELSNNFAKDFSAAGAEDETIYIATYRVAGNKISDPYFESVPAEWQDEQDDLAAHQKIWDYFASLIPLEYRPTIAEFSVTTDGTDNVLAAVAQTYDDPNLWGLEVDIADTSDYYYLSFTLVHEFAHLLTLAPDQVPPSIAIFNNPDDNDIYFDEVSACSTFFPGEGCSNPDSYINAFYEAFWLDIVDEWNEINLIEDEDEYYDALDEFYYKYEDQFLTSYSPTHPAEDIAEAFGFFVFAEQPNGDTVAEQKILFFYQYPELVQLRESILANVCVNFPQ